LKYPSYCRNDWDSIISILIFALDFHKKFEAKLEEWWKTGSRSVEGRGLQQGDVSYSFESSLNNRLEEKNKDMDHMVGIMKAFLMKFNKGDSSRSQGGMQNNENSFVITLIFENFNSNFFFFRF